MARTRPAKTLQQKLPLAGCSGGNSNTDQMPAAELVSFLIEVGVSTWSKQDLQKALKIGAEQAKMPLRFWSYNRRLSPRAVREMESDGIKVISSLDRTRPH